MNILQQLETTYIPNLKSQFSRARPILFLGSGFSLGAKNNTGKPIPSVSQLTRILWDLCFPGDEFDETTELQDIFDTAMAQQARNLGNILKEQFTVDLDSCAPWYHQFLTMPWSRIYTLNIDDLVAKVLSSSSGPRVLRTVSATSIDYIPEETANLSIIHLNGTLEDIPNNVTFSRSQYAQRDIYKDQAYQSLRIDLQLRPAVFVGSSLEENPLWAHIGLRGNKPTGRELRPRSYLVIPKINRSKEALLTKFNIVHMPYTAQEFNSCVLSNMEEARDDGINILRNAARNSQRDAEKFSTVSQLVEAFTRSENYSEEYLLGAEPTWDDVKHMRIANRCCFDDLWQKLSELRADPAGRKFVLVTGTAGTGKTSSLMVTARQLEANGMSVAWVDQDSNFSRKGFNEALRNSPTIDAVFLNDADIYGGLFSLLVHDALEFNPKLLIVAESRSTKIDNIIDRQELRDIREVEFTVPPLTDGDISGLLDVLDREHRLGELKGMSRTEREKIFRGLAGRQMLVAMHIATHGRDFKIKAMEELEQLTPNKQFIYGIICVATAHRLTLNKRDIGIAVGGNDTTWLEELDDLMRRKLALPRRDNALRARHRVVAQFVYESLAHDGKLADIVRGLLLIGASNASPTERIHFLYNRLLRTFLNHNFMNRSIGVSKAREIYAEFETVLAWNHHYWLHRGAIELESDNLEMAENFLRQAKAIGDHDVFVDNELAYLMLKKANANPDDPDSPTFIEEAIDDLVRQSTVRPDLGAHAFHIIGRQGILWVDSGIKTSEEKVLFLERIKSIVEKGASLHPTDMMRDIQDAVKRKYLELTVDNSYVE